MKSGGRIPALAEKGGLQARRALAEAPAETCE